MSVRAVAVRRDLHPRLQVVPRQGTLRPAWRHRFADDREFVRLKLVLLALLALAAMAVEFRL